MLKYVVVLFVISLYNINLYNINMKTLMQIFEKKEVLHYPTLKTVLQVEEILEKANDALNKSQIKKKLEKDIMHQTLSVILEYLKESNKIIKDKDRKYVWIYNSNPKLQKAIDKGTRVR